MTASPKVICPPPRINQACGRCRATKARCLPSDQPLSCQRCLDRGYTCRFPQHNKRNTARRRSKTSFTSSNGSSTTTSNVGSNVIAGLGYPSGVASLPVSRSGSYSQVDDVCLHHQHVFDRLFSKDRDAESPRPNSNPMRSAQDTIPRTHISDTSSMPILSDDDISAHLYHYQSLHDYFPFLPLPDDWTVESMKSSHPFFLLGVLAAVSQHQTSLNPHLHKQFLRVLAERVVIKAEKSLDLLRGMLAQLSRFPLHLDPKKGVRRMFQMVRLCASMIEDLCFPELRDQSWLDSHSHDLRLDQCRLADLACAGISSIASISFQRSNCAPLAKAFTRATPAVVFVGDESGAASDLVYIQASLLRVAEEASRYRRDSHKDAATVYVILECLRSEVNEITGSIRTNSTASSRAVFKLSLHYAESQINTLVFDKSGLARWSNDVESHEWILSAMKCCLNGTREFLETFTSLPIAGYRDLSFVQWAQLVQVLKLIPTLCFKNHEVIGWSPAQIRKELRFGMILESLCYRMHELTQAERNSKVQPGTEDSPEPLILPPNWFVMFKSVLKILKETYDRRCEEAERDERIQLPGLGCPVLNGSIEDSEFWFELMEFQQDSIGSAHLAGTHLSDVGFTFATDQPNGDEWSNFNILDISQI